MAVFDSRAGIAQMVEHNLAKVGVAGSNPVSRSIRRNSKSRATTSRLLRLTPPAAWQSGYAAACKAVDAGSIPTAASSLSSNELQQAQQPAWLLGLSLFCLSNKSYKSIVSQ